MFRHDNGAGIRIVEVSARRAFANVQGTRDHPRDVFSANGACEALFRFGARFMTYKNTSLNVTQQRVDQLRGGFAMVTSLMISFER